MTRVFVYGSLLSGGGNHRLLASARFIGAARTLPAFDMHDLGAFPAVVAGGSTAVVGEIYEVDAATLQALDRLEGHPRWYRRVAIELDAGQQAETYLLQVEQVRGRPRVESGDWRARTTTTRET